MEGHIPVMRAEVLEHLRAVAGPWAFLDATFGGGGHTRALLEAHDANTVHALDTDPDARSRAEAVRADYGERFQFTSGNFEDLDTLVAGTFDGMLFDFGLSSFHFDTAERGFAFRLDGPLDMRLNPEKGETAHAFLERASRHELIVAIRQYGEEARWRRIVDAIEMARGTEALARTLAFAELIENALGPSARRHARIHPATKTFQGIRIAINRELEVIEATLPVAFAKLNPGGRLAVISFHSLEDRIVKRYFRRLGGRPESARDHRTADQRPIYAREITRRPLVPSEEECAHNPRSRSAKLRVIEKLPLASAA